MGLRALQSTVAAVRTVDDDAELVVAARRDARAFLALYDRYVDRVHGYVRLRIADPDRREDVTSQVFATALERLAQFRGEGSFGGWLFQIARNAINDVHRQPASEGLSSRELSLVDPGAGPEEQVLRKQRLARLRTLIRALPADQQHLLALRYGAELDYEQIAEILDTTPGALRVRLHRLLHDLRRRYPDDEA
jgi:RNA polymerase sigma-70 factor (ECF subfamily)